MKKRKMRRKRNRLQTASHSVGLHMRTWEVYNLVHIVLQTHENEHRPLAILSNCLTKEYCPSMRFLKTIVLDWKMMPWCSSLLETETYKFFHFHKQSPSILQHYVAAMVPSIALHELVWCASHCHVLDTPGHGLIHWTSWHKCGRSPAAYRSEGKWTLGSWKG